MGQHTFSRSLSAKMRRASVIAIVLFLALSTMLPGTARCQAPSRRISSGLQMSYLKFDPDFFGIDYGISGDIVLKYEMFGSLYFENKLGIFTADSETVRVNGFNGQVGLSVFATHFLPYRPFARGALGLLSVNPVTATPTDTYRPTQTTFYFILGLGVSRYIWKELLVEIGGDVMFTPYNYVIYSFDRQSVVSEAAQFTHFGINLGASWTF